MTNRTNIVSVESLDTCSHDYMRTDCVCTECGGRAPARVHPIDAEPRAEEMEDKRDAERYRTHVRYEYENLYLPSAKKKGLHPLTFDEYKASADLVADAARPQGSQS